jgi:hypothetical protein
MRDMVPTEAELRCGDSAWQASIARGAAKRGRRIEAVKRQMAIDGPMRRRLTRMVTDWKRWAGNPTPVFQRSREHRASRRATARGRRSRSSRGDPQPGDDGPPSAVAPTAVGRRVHGAVQLARPDRSGSWFA